MTCACRDLAGERQGRPRMRHSLDMSRGRRGCSIPERYNRAGRGTSRQAGMSLVSVIPGFRRRRLRLRPAHHTTGHPARQTPERDRGAGWTVDWASCCRAEAEPSTPEPGNHGHQRHPGLPRCPLARLDCIVSGSSSLAARVTCKESAAYAGGLAVRLPDHGRRTS